MNKYEIFNFTESAIDTHPHLADALHAIAANPTAPVMRHTHGMTVTLADRRFLIRIRAILISA